MPHVRFTERFDFHVKPNVTISYKAGRQYLVTRACADKALKAGKAVAIERPEVLDNARRRSAQ